MEFYLYDCRLLVRKSENHCYWYQEYQPLDPKVIKLPKIAWSAVVFASIPKMHNKIMWTRILKKYLLVYIARNWLERRLKMSEKNIRGLSTSFYTFFKCLRNIKYIKCFTWWKSRARGSDFKRNVWTLCKLTLWGLWLIKTLGTESILVCDDFIKEKIK